MTQRCCIASGPCDTTAAVHGFWAGGWPRCVSFDHTMRPHDVVCDVPTVVVAHPGAS